MSNTVAIIPARGGSKGIPRKNLTNVCGHPLIAWSICQALKATEVDIVCVSSDDIEILHVAESYGAIPILRPESLSGDNASSESAWIHAIEFLELAGYSIDTVVAMQATSPIREPEDIDKALYRYHAEAYNSILSVVEVEDFFIWGYPENSPFVTSLNYNYQDRQPRQKISKKYLENGSIYVFSPSGLRASNNRLHGTVGLYVMDKHKLFQIDNPEDIDLCVSIIKGYGYAI